MILMHSAINLIYVYKYKVDSFIIYTVMAYRKILIRYNNF